MLGASFANDKDNYNVTKAFEYMMRAMELRYSDQHHVIRKQLIEPVRAYDYWVETENIQVYYNKNVLLLFDKFFVDRTC